VVFAPKGGERKRKKRYPCRSSAESTVYKQNAQTTGRKKKKELIKKDKTEGQKRSKLSVHVRSEETLGKKWGSSYEQTSGDSFSPERTKIQKGQRGKKKNGPKYRRPNSKC